MLLARLPDAPPGAGGISLLLVPNVLPDGTKNAVECVSLNKKMGHRAISNAAWTLDGATGYLVGEAHGGLAAVRGNCCRCCCCCCHYRHYCFCCYYY